MYTKRKSYKTSSYKRTSKPKTYRNGYVKTAKSLTAYLNGYKLIMTSYDQIYDDNVKVKFNLTKNSQIVGKVTATYWLQGGNLVLSWKSKQYVLTKLK